MKTYPTNDLRNIFLFGSGGSGKTTLAEALFYNAGITTRLGKIEEGNTVSDFTNEEIRRRNSLYLSLCFIEHKEKKINLLDTPGYADFISELYAGMNVCEGVIFVLDGSVGLDTSSEMLWEETTNKGLAYGIYINSLDKEEINFWALVKTIKERLVNGAQLFYFPYGEGVNFSGIVDVLNLKLVKFTDKKIELMEIPKEIEEIAQKEHNQLIESITSENEELIEKYLEGKGIAPEELKVTLQKAIREGKIVPIFCGSAKKNIGPQVLLDFIIDYFPQPKVSENNSLSALIFKTYLPILKSFRVFSLPVWIFIIRPVGFVNGLARFVVCRVKNVLIFLLYRQVISDVLLNLKKV